MWAIDLQREQTWVKLWGEVIESEEKPQVNIWASNSGGNELKMSFDLNMAIRFKWPFKRETDNIGNTYALEFLSIISIPVLVLGDNGILIA